jgi:AcrR family transcriptional regulator/DNA-binding MarR family transcriptional regulator
MPSRAVSRRGAQVSVARRGARRSRAAAAEPTPGTSVPREQLVEIQRSRLLAAAVVAVDELGYADTTVSDVTSRARVSRRTFYELFANREECLAAVLEDVVALIEGEVAAADLDGLPWRERVRGGLWAILSFLDREPALARVCVVQALCGGPRLLARREEILAGLAAVVDEGRLDARGGGCTPLTAEGVVGAAFAIVYARLLRVEREPLTGLLGELMGMIVLPYMGAAAARREQVRPAPARPLRAADGPASGGVVGDPLQGVSMRLTYRTARVLEGVAECSGGSNREVAECAGIQDPGQVSKLLARLERLGLLVNTGEGHAKGEPNAWSLTPKGRLVAQSVRLHVRGEWETA